MDELIIKKQLEKRIPEFDRFKFKIKVDKENKEVIIQGKNGTECLADSKNKSISQIITKLKPCIKKIISTYK